MEVILKEDVKALGKKGKLVKVSDGYARNYLFPRNLAIEANATNVNSLNNKKQAEERRQVYEKEQAMEQKKRLENLTVTITAKGSNNGKLFGSITSKEISEVLKVTHNIEIDKKKIVLNDIIKNLGEYTVDIKLYTEVSAKITVHIVE